jgi:peptidoglycan/LPS O-acetylase OafA/YrhL
MSEKHSTYLPYLDGWRGLAIGFLLIGHFFPVRGINLGSAGVNLFFVLSGFLMARLLFVDEVPIPSFYKRRVSRIFPAVVCFLTIATAMYFVLGKSVSWKEVAAAAAFVINYFPGEPGAAVMPFGHIWSLCVEEHSYILLSIVALATRARLLTAQTSVGLLAALFAVIGLGYSLVYHGQHLEFDRWIHSEVSAFGIFVSAFFCLAARGRKIPRLAVPVLPVLILLGFALHWWSVPAPIRTVFGVGAFALAVNLLEHAPPFMQSALSWRPLRQLGLWSFSIYLWQQPFYLYFGGSSSASFIGVGLAVVAGIVSFYLLESPARIYLNRKWSHKSPIGVQHSEKQQVSAT